MIQLIPALNIVLTIHILRMRKLWLELRMSSFKRQESIETFTCQLSFAIYSKIGFFGLKLVFGTCKYLEHPSVRGDSSSGWHAESKLVLSSLFSFNSQPGSALYQGSPLSSLAPFILCSSGTIGTCLPIAQCQHIQSLLSSLQVKELQRSSLYFTPVLQSLPAEVSLLMRESFSCTSTPGNVSVCCPPDSARSPDRTNTTHFPSLVRTLPNQPR